MVAFVLTAVAAVVVTLFLIFVLWGVAKLFGLAFAKSPEDALNAALSHPEPVNKTPVEIVRDALVPKPLSDEEHRFAYETAKRLAAQGNPTTPYGPSPTPTPGATGTAGTTAGSMSGPSSGGLNLDDLKKTFAK